LALAAGDPESYSIVIEDALKRYCGANATT